RERIEVIVRPMTALPPRVVDLSYFSPCWKPAAGRTTPATPFRPEVGSYLSVDTALFTLIWRSVPYIPERVIVSFGNRISGRNAENLVALRLRDDALLDKLNSDRAPTARCLARGKPVGVKM